MNSTLNPLFMFLRGPIFLYLGPETVMPLGSVIAAAIGLLLIGWRWILAFFRKAYYKVSGKEPPAITSASESDLDED